MHACIHAPHAFASKKGVWRWGGLRQTSHKVLSDGAGPTRPTGPHIRHTCCKHCCAWVCKQLAVFAGPHVNRDPIYCICATAKRKQQDVTATTTRHSETYLLNQTDLRIGKVSSASKVMGLFADIALLQRCDLDGKLAHINKRLIAEQEQSTQL